MLKPIKRLRDYASCAFALGVSPRDKWSIFWKETKNLRVRCKLGIYNPHEVYALQTIYGPLYFRDNFGDITNLVDLFYHQVYRVRALSQEGAILDIGANIGLAATWFAYYNPDRPIYCFEPLAANVALIGRNCPFARVEQVTVGGRRGRVTLRVDRDNVMASHILCQWDTHEVEFEVVSLDEFVVAQGLEHIALIKVDVEGMEVEVLQGGQKTLKKTQQVVMETHSRALHNEAIGHLRRAGLDIDAEQFVETTGLIFASRREAEQP